MWYPLLPYHQRSIYPATIPAGCLFHKLVVVHFDPHILVRRSPSQDEAFTGYTRYGSWIPGPEESLRFEAELIRTQIYHAILEYSDGQWKATKFEGDDMEV